MATPPGNKEQGINVKRRHFSESTKSLFMDSKTADFWFLFGSVVNQIRIPVHKAMLAKESEVFSAMFYGEMKEENNEVEIVDVNDEEFAEFAQFFYGDKMTISIKNLPKLMYLSNKYLVIELLRVCDEVIAKHLPLEKLILGCDLADLYDRFELKAKLEAKISENTNAFFATDEFRECSYERLKSILGIDQLMCDPIDVFYACINWTATPRENYEDGLSEMEIIKKQLGECLYLIPFYVMSSEQITLIVTVYEELFDRSEIVELMNMMTLTGSMNRMNVKKFQFKYDFSLYSNVSWRWRWRLDSESKIWIKQQEVVNLSYPNKNVLKAIQPFFIWHTGTECVKILSGVMKIVRQVTAEPKETILLKQPFSFSCRNNQLCTSLPTIKFLKPIIMESEKSYKIQFDFNYSWSKETFYSLKTSTKTSDFMPLICYDDVYK